MDFQRLCLQSANRSYMLERLAETDDDRAYWRASAQRWIALFWAFAAGPPQGDA